MPRPRKPTKVLEMQGAYKANPQRKKERVNEPKPDTDIGNPPRGFTAAQKKIWQEMIDITPDGVITRMDRFILEVVSVMLCRFREAYTGRGKPLQSSEYGILMRALTSLGMTPADRSKVLVPPEKTEDDGWDRA